MKSCITISQVEEARGGPFVLWDEPVASCRFAAELGYDAVELFAPGPEAISVASLRSTLDELELELAAVGTGAGWIKHGLSLTHPGEQQRAHAIAFVESMIDVGGQFGAPAIIGSMQGRHGADIHYDQATELLASALKHLGDYSAKYQIPLIYEPLNRYETNLCNTMAEGVDLLESNNVDNVILLADLFHMNIEEVDLGQAIRAAAKHIGHVHFVDSNRWTVGAGHMDFAPIMAALRDVNYNGYLSVEAFPLPDSITAAKRQIESFRHWTQL